MYFLILIQNFPWGGVVTPCHGKGVVFLHHSNEGLSLWWIFRSW